MVVEHEFVTTMDPTAALTAAAHFLSAGGFASDAAAFAPGQTQWTTLDMRRGKKNASRAKSVAELPQRVLLQYDRGRLNVAASITASYIWGARSGLNVGFGLSATTESPKKMHMHQDLLLGILTGLERLLVAGEAPAAARTQWDAAEAVIATAARRRRKRLIIIGAIAITAIVGAIALVVYAAMS